MDVQIKELYTFLDSIREVDSSRNITSAIKRAAKVIFENEEEEQFYIQTIASDFVNNFSEPIRNLAEEFRDINKTEHIVNLVFALGSALNDIYDPDLADALDDYLLDEDIELDDYEIKEVTNLAKKAIETYIKSIGNIVIGVLDQIPSVPVDY